jgi:hypothetical protein
MITQVVAVALKKGIGKQKKKIREAYENIYKGNPNISDTKIICKIHMSRGYEIRKLCISF